jgi:hypothetical protein
MSQAKKKTIPRKRFAKPSAADLLDKHAAKLTGRTGPKTEPFPDDVIAVIDEANRRRLQGERIALQSLARLIVDEFKLTFSVNHVALRIKQHVGRTSW